MNAVLDHYTAFIHSQARPGEKNGVKADDPGAWAVTISRQAGCGAPAVAEKLAAYLQNFSRKDSIPWTVFDRNLIDKVLEDHQLPAYLSKYLKEEHISQVEDFVTELLGSQPPQWKMVRQSAETVLRLVRMGNVILIGRGSTAITARFPRVLRVRLVAPLEKRVEYAQRVYGMTKAAAHAFCLREDHDRAQYLKKYFQMDAGDALNYHLVLNTGLLGYDETARLIGAAALSMN